ncbi:MAG: 5'-nucleotidase C-terminal domain-containing protein [Deltaproteobacteria bacterium]|nr:5'-nucleotidase C-terminal domain-containing protein [Deltaproteobacteria bacterium]
MYHKIFSKFTVYIFTALFFLPLETRGQNPVKNAVIPDSESEKKVTFSTVLLNSKALGNNNKKDDNSRISIPKQNSTSGKTSDIRNVRILYFSDLNGRFAPPGCSKGNDSRSFLQLKLLARKIRVNSMDDGKQPPIVISGGNMIFPDAFGNFIFSDEKRSRWGVRLIKDMAIDSIALGLNDLSAPDGKLERYLKSGFSEKLQFIGTNIECTGKKDPRCGKYIKRFGIIERNGVRIGVVSLFNPDHHKHLVKKNGKWLKFEDPVKAWKKWSSWLYRIKKVDAIILVSHLDRAITYPSSVLSFLRNSGDIEPTLVLSSGTFRPDFRNQSYIPVIKQTQGPWMVGSSRDAQSLTSIDLKFRVMGTKKILVRKKTRIRNLVPRLQRLPLREKYQISKMMKKFCKTTDRQLGGASFKGSFSPEQFLGYIMGILRVVYRSEVAFLNHGILYDDMFPLRGKVTEEKIIRTILTDNQLVTFTVKGSVLKSLLGGFITEKNGISVLGITKKDSSFYVNHRIVDDEQHFRVVTTKFLAEGGGGFISALTTGISEKNEGIRTAVLKWFEKGMSTRLTGNPQVSMKDFPDMWKSYVFSSGMNMGFNSGGIAILNDNIYPDKTQLSRQNLKQFNLDFSFNAGISSASNALSLTSRVLYGKTWSYVINEETGEKIDAINETTDEIKMNLLYQWKRPKNFWFGNKWYSPVPFADIGWQTEFTPSIDEETKRYNLYTAISGIGWEIWESRLFFKIGAGFREELSAQDEKSQATLYAGWQLINGDIMKLKHFTLKGESRLDMYVFKSTRDGIFSSEISSSNKLYISLTERLFLNITNEVYAFKKASGRWSVGVDLLFGLNVIYDMRIPFFVF